MGRSNQVWTKLATVAVGLICTLFVAITAQVGRLGPIEDVTVDFRFRHFPTVGDSGRVTVIAIDDGSLASIGDWPWPRTRQAEIVDIVHELGAKVVAIDLTYTKPRPVRAGGADTRGEFLDEDAALAVSLRRGGNVVLAGYFGEGIENSAAVDALADDIKLTPQELSERLGQPIELIEPIFARLARFAARKLAIRALGSESALSEERFLYHVLGDDWLRQTDARRELKRGYGYARAYLAVRDKAGFALAGPIPKDMVAFPAEGSMIVPIQRLAQAGADFGFVNFSSRQVLRQVRLLAAYDGKVYCQLALTAVSRYLLAEMDLQTVPARLIRLEPADKTIGPIEVPLDAEGRLIVNWYNPSEGKWHESFPNLIPASYLLDLAANRKALAVNRAKLDSAIGRTIYHVMRPRYERYVKARKNLRLLESGQGITPFSPRSTQATTRSTATATSRPSSALDETIENLLAQTRQELEKLTKQASEQLDWLKGQIDELPLEEQTQGQSALIHELWQYVFKPQRAHQANAALRADIDARLKSLRERIDGKIVMIGYTATTLADFVPTAVFDRCPGVLVHANIVNQILERSFFSESRRSTNMLIILGLGMIVSVVTAQRSALGALAWMLMLLVAYSAVNCYVLFAKMHIISPLVGPVFAIFLSWSGVTLYRQITEGRAKRRFASRLSQYTSPALVRRMTESPGAMMLAPQQCNVSCFFSDLAGFTPLSEQLGAQQTVRLLNLYLEHMSESLDRYEAFINKFQGDGIFAFFNPPLNPQQDHSRRASQAAVHSQEHLPHVQEHLEEVGFSLARPLEMRIGISSGPAFVGDCGSTRKFDYTCLGDTVNLGSRLEAANKYFGTRIMIDEATYVQMGEDLAARLLGKIRVVGRERPVTAYELIGYKKDQTDRLEYIGEFEKMVRAYWLGDFDETGCLLARLEQMPQGATDQPLRIYQALLRRIESEGKGIHQAGIIELETK